MKIAPLLKNSNLKGEKNTVRERCQKIKIKMSREFNAPNCLKYFLFRYMLNNYLAHYNIKRSSLEGDRLQIFNPFMTTGFYMITASVMKYLRLFRD